ncbi:MAG TPA: DUF1295 domain-containing protein [Candidatus Paceibacterota bacterium]|nr:DUF1295 domain-containing protein [Candidatus Paceibacterota bacterium]HMO82709.1 DUF1295 domain-containing protein [Candidatus Paceibacterota bacterium]
METLLFNTMAFGSIILVLVTIIFIVAQIKNDNSIMDIAYGPLFLVSGLIFAYLKESFTLIATIILVLTALWAGRLGLRIWLKNKGRGEDIRYANWRRDWMIKGKKYFYLRSYLQINLLQGLIILLVSLPLIISFSFPKTINITFLILGLSIFALGFILETTADYQVDRFLAKKRAGTNLANILTTGLFRFSRRPNYFGETLIWWGMAVMVLPLPYGFLGLISPLLITYIVTKITGPMLEKIFLEKYGTEYASYMKRTNYFVPGLPKIETKSDIT